jgi:hypothetical protein
MKRHELACSRQFAGWYWSVSIPVAFELGRTFQIRQELDALPPHYRRTRCGAKLRDPERGE